jgi:putative ABC transport system ATP-binding protein
LHWWDFQATIGTCVPSDRAALSLLAGVGADLEAPRSAGGHPLVNDSALVLADEPIANLDSKTRHEPVRLLRRIARQEGRSVVIVSHDQRIRDSADRVLWLEDGRFPEMAARATDPVSEVQVDLARAVSREWGGRTLRFCSRGCEAEFMAIPRPS